MMSDLIKRLALRAVLALAVAMPVTALAGNTLEQVVDSKVLRVGMSGNQPPLNMVNRSGGIMGLDVDLAKALAGAMQVKLEIKPIPFGDLMTALEEGQIDMVISGMSITAERTRNVSFVGPYMMSGKSILTKDTTLASISASEEVNRKGLKLAALTNSTSASFVSRVAPEAELIQVVDYDEGVAMVREDRADALVADMPICQLSVMRYPDAGLVTLKQPLTVEPIGIAVSRNDPQFLNLVDNFLEAYGRIGVLAQLRKRWLEDGSWIAALP